MIRRRHVLAVVLILSSQVSGQGSVDNVVISPDIGTIAALAPAFGVTVEGACCELDAVQLHAPSGPAMDALIDEIAARAIDVEIEALSIAESALLSGPSSVPVINPEGAASAAEMADSLWNGPPLNLPAAPVTVAVVDTGVELSHPALQGRIHAASRDFIEPGTPPDDVADGIDNDGDGVVDRAFGHGTHLCGIIALSCPSISVLALRVVDDEGRSDSFRLARSIVYAVDQGARAINLSLSLPGQPAIVRLALELAESRGVVVLTSAGNDGARVSRFPSGVPGVVTIGATESISHNSHPFVPWPERIASFSNYGFVDYAALGVDVPATYPGGTFASWNGTSMATAVASATFAWMMAVEPGISRAEAERRLQMTAIDVMRHSPLGPDALGHGRINPLAALFLCLEEGAP